MDAVIQWAQALPPWLGIALITLLPFLELRASIPYGILAAGLPPWQAALLAIAFNWLLAPLVYLLLQLVLRYLLRWPWFDRLWSRYSIRVLQRTERYTNTWGSLGLALFIAVPLPGSGVYSGAVAAYLLGMRLRRFTVVSLLGVILAGLAVTLIVVSGNEALSWMVKPPGSHEGAP